MKEKAYLDSPFGCFVITGSEKGIRSVRLAQNGEIPSDQVPASLQNCYSQLKEYFAGKRTAFDLKLDWENATDFNKAVWEALLQIPYGHTSSYSAIAKKIGDIKAVRAVGLANRNNPIPIIVPCHRVLAKNGDLHGYFYGLEMKRKLLELENPMSFAEQGTLF